MSAVTTLRQNFPLLEKRLIIQEAPVSADDVSAGRSFCRAHDIGRSLLSYASKRAFLLLLIILAEPSGP